MVISLHLLDESERRCNDLKITTYSGGRLHIQSMLLYSLEGIIRKEPI